MPVIETARLRLRPLTLDDADAYYHAIMKDPDVRRYLPGGEPRPRSEAEPILSYFMKYWEQYGLGAFAIIHQADDELIGQCGIQFVPNTTEIEVFYALDKAYWGQGLATEAAHACLRYGFESHHVDRIIALFMPGNVASERVMIKLGMTYQGTRHAYKTDDLPWYMIARADFEAGDAPYTLHP